MAFILCHHCIVVLCPSFSFLIPHHYKIATLKAWCCCICECTASSFCHEACGFEKTWLIAVPVKMVYMRAVCADAHYRLVRSAYFPDNVCTVLSWILVYLYLCVWCLCWLNMSCLFSGEFEVYRLVRYHMTVSLQHHVLFCNVLWIKRSHYEGCVNFALAKERRELGCFLYIYIYLGCFMYFIYI